MSGWAGRLRAGGPPAAAALEGAKQLAVLCMALNHLALAWPAPWPLWGVWVGRLSMPVFATLTALHLREDTEARAERYLPRLLGWALLSQPIYSLFFFGQPWGRLNALATLAAGVCLIYLHRRLGLLAALLAAGLVWQQSAWLEGGVWMPLAQWLAWWVLSQRPAAWPGAVLLVSAMACGMNAQALGRFTGLAWAALVLPPLLIAVSPGLSARLRRWPRWAYYAFYPLHLALILAWRGPLV